MTVCTVIGKATITPLQGYPPLTTFGYRIKWNVTVGGTVPNDLRLKQAGLIGALIPAELSPLRSNVSTQARMGSNRFVSAGRHDLGTAPRRVGTYANCSLINRLIIYQHLYSKPIMVSGESLEISHIDDSWMEGLLITSSSSYINTGSSPTTAVPITSSESPE